MINLNYNILPFALDIFLHDECWNGIQWDENKKANHPDEYAQWKTTMHNLMLNANIGEVETENDVKIVQFELSNNSIIINSFHCSAIR